MSSSSLHVQLIIYKRIFSSIGKDYWYYRKFNHLDERKSISKQLMLTDLQITRSIHLIWLLYNIELFVKTERSLVNPSLGAGGVSNFSSVSFLKCPWRRQQTVTSKYLNFYLLYECTYMHNLYKIEVDRTTKSAPIFRFCTKLFFLKSAKI